MAKSHQRLFVKGAANDDCILRYWLSDRRCVWDSCSRVCLLSVAVVLKMKLKRIVMANLSDRVGCAYVDDPR